MKITLKVVQDRHRVYKNGTSPIFIRCILNRKSKFISAGVAVNPAHWDIEKCCITADCPDRTELQHKIDAKLQSVQKQIAKLEVLDMEITLDALSENKAKPAHLTLEAHFRRQIEHFKKAGKIHSSIKHSFALSSLIKYGKADVLLKDIDLAFLEGFEQSMREAGNASNTIATKMSAVKSVYNKWMMEDVATPMKSPFLRYKVGKLITPTRKRAVAKDVVLRLSALEFPQSRYGYMDFARDIFLFSYYTAGMNFRDIATLKYCDIETGRITYTRGKTGKIINCLLIQPAKDILDRYSRAEHSGEDYIFPILDRKTHITEQQIHDRIHKVLQNVNRRLRVISSMLGLSRPITTYVARHGLQSFGL